MPLLFLLFISLLGDASAALASDRSLNELQQFNLLLQAEYDLSKSDNPYWLIDLQEQQLVLKANGVILETLQVEDFRSWGRVPVLAVTCLVRKSSLIDPEREVQVVKTMEHEPNEFNKPFKAFELADMPTAYRLHLDNGTQISVGTKALHWLGRLRKALAIPLWYLSRPLISNWNFLLGSPYNELALSMSEQDARKLYWAFRESTPCLIRLPATVALIPASAETKR
jgi:hypothetical protein